MWGWKKRKVKNKKRKKKEKMILSILTCAWLLIGGSLHHLDFTFWCIFVHLDPHCLPFFSRKRKGCFGDESKPHKMTFAFHVMYNWAQKHTKFVQFHYWHRLMTRVRLHWRKNKRLAFNFNMTNGSHNQFVQWLFISGKIECNLLRSKHIL